MRPPRIAAEYANEMYTESIEHIASMRPPRIAAEYKKKAGPAQSPVERFNEAAANRGGIRLLFLRRAWGLGSFNEAAANRGGIHVGAHRFPLRFAASMRPPRIAAEYKMSGRSGDKLGKSFNEAAANRGGIRRPNSL